MSYKEFLENKPLFYKEIDFERMPSVWQKIKHNFKLPKIIHIVGTNGKGSTGRFLAYYLYKKGYKTGHYTSPHILSFNERIWLNGKDIDDRSLENAHKILQNILEKDDSKSLSYFEYTTLLAMQIFQECDYIIFEAGLGGEYDATSVFENILTLVTPIDYDHREFLGSSIKEIAKTKLKAIKKRAIIGYQPHYEVWDVALDLSKKMGFEVKDFKEFMDKDTEFEVRQFLKRHAFPSFFQNNIFLAISAIIELGFEFDVKLFEGVTIFGRFQKIAPNIIIDVGHNALAATAVKEALKDKKVTLVYNSYKDKEYEKILSILKPVIKRIEILPIDNERAEEKKELLSAVERLGLSYGDFKGVKKEENYLIFGSFSVVEEFLKEFFER